MQDNDLADVEIYKQFELDMIISINSSIWNDSAPCPTNPCVANIIQIGLGGNGGNIQDQNPAIFISPAASDGDVLDADTTAALTFKSAVDGVTDSIVKKIDYDIFDDDQYFWSGYDKKITLRVSQLLNQNGNYVKRIYMRRHFENEDPLVNEVTNTQPLEIETAKIHLGNPTDLVPTGFYQNLRFVSHDCEVDYWFDGENCLRTKFVNK